MTRMIELRSSSFTSSITANCILSFWIDDNQLPAENGSSSRIIEIRNSLHLIIINRHLILGAYAIGLYRLVLTILFVWLLHCFWDMEFHSAAYRFLGKCVGQNLYVSSSEICSFILSCFYIRSDLLLEFTPLNFNLSVIHSSTFLPINYQRSLPIRSNKEEEEEAKRETDVRVSSKLRAGVLSLKS